MRKEQSPNWICTKNKNKGSNRKRRGWEGPPRIVRKGLFVEVTFKLRTKRCEGTS